MDTIQLERRDRPGMLLGLAMAGQASLRLTRSAAGPNGDAK